MSFTIPFSVYVIWHPQFADGPTIAGQLYSAFCRDTAKPLVRSIGIPVYFRWISPKGSSHPIDIDYAEADYTAVVALVDSKMLLDENYKDYLRKIRRECEGSAKRRFFPVALSDHAFKVDPQIAEINFIRARTASGIISSLSHEFCRLLMEMKRTAEETAPATPGTTQPVRLFISHSKYDDSLEQAKKLRDFIRSESQLDSFFDANDIAFGSDFGDMIKIAAAGNILVVFQSDSYADREWCRIEALTAKSAGCPVIIVNNVQTGEKRTFPYLGNYPSIRATGDMQKIVDMALDQVLFNLFTSRLLKAQAILYKVNIDFILANYPELFDFILLRQALNNIDPANGQTLVLYPDPPLGKEEMDILHKMDHRLLFLTPILLSTIKSRKKHVGTIGISISESDDLNELGLANSHLKDAMTEMARYILAAGGSLAYGGDMRKDGFTTLMFDLIKYYRNEEDLPARRFYSYLAWPISLSLTEEDEISLVDKVSFKRVTPPENIGIQNEGEALQPDTPANSYIWARCLTKMREEMANHCSAHVFIGGRAKGFRGKCPGVLEEALIAIGKEHPVYFAGAFGGVSNAIGQALQGHRPEILTKEYQLKDPSYSALYDLYNERTPRNLIDYDKYLATFAEWGIDGLSAANGLSPDENKRLFITPHIQEIVYLVLKGISSLHTPTP